MPRILPSFLAALACAAILIPGAAEAYIGPGVGAGAFAAVMGVLGSIFLAIVGVIYYPIKRMLKRKKSSSPAKPAE
jgi:TM2 domain-containing membrane protein YozV